MAQRVHLSPIGLPMQKKTFIAKTAVVVVALVREKALFNIYIDQSRGLDILVDQDRSKSIYIDQKRKLDLNLLN